MLGSPAVPPRPADRPAPRLPDLAGGGLAQRPLPERLVAHRGFAARYPENTLLALEQAVSLGARFVEIDVQLSSDGRPVLFHDRTLERMCGAEGPVHGRTLEELRRLACGEPAKFGEAFAAVRIAELEDLVELLRSHRDVFAFVEIKRASIERFGIEKVLGATAPVLDPVRGQVALISFSLPFLTVARAGTDLPLGAVFDQLVEREQPEARAIRAEFTFCDVGGLPRHGPLDVGRSKLAVYEVADARLALDLFRRGVALVETFAIGEMIPAVRDLEARSP
jgi:glycerophosphoryl diester phosphodiesterase